MEITCITGHKGFIGSNLWDTIGGDKVGVDVKEGKDVRFLEHIPDADRYIHLAAISGIADCDKNPLSAFHVNYSGTKNVSEKAKRNDAPLIFASSNASIRMSNLYGAYKRAAEDYLAKRNKTVSFLRLGNVFGPGSLHKSSCIASFCKQAILEGAIMVHGTGTQARHFVFVNDVVDAIKYETSRTYPGLKILNIGCPRPTKIIEVASLIADLSGARIVHTDAPNAYEQQPPPVSQWEYGNAGRLESDIAKTWTWFKENYRTPPR